MTMKGWKMMLAGAAIAVAAILAYIAFDKPDTLGERFDEAVEEVGDEIDDNT